MFYSVFTIPLGTRKKGKALYTVAGSHNLHITIKWLERRKMHEQPILKQATAWVNENFYLSMWLTNSYVYDKTIV